MYRQQMPATTRDQLTIEKTPSYFVTKSVPHRVHNMSSTVRLIVVVRDPVTRAVSDYTQAIAKQRDASQRRPFHELAFLDRNASTDGPVSTGWGAVRIGVYARHLERWLRYFPPTQIHFVHGERLISDPAAELAAVQDFLGLRRLVTEDMFFFSSTKGFPCLRRRRRSVDTRPSLPADGPLVAGDSGPTVETPRCLGKTKGRTHPPIDEKVLQRLRHFYRPFNSKFYRLTGRDFGWN